MRRVWAYREKPMSVRCCKRNVFSANLGETQMQVSARPQLSPKLSSKLRSSFKRRVLTWHVVLSWKWKYMQDLNVLSANKLMRVYMW